MTSMIVSLPGEVRRSRHRGSKTGTAPRAGPERVAALGDAWARCGSISHAGSDHLGTADLRAIARQQYCPGPVVGPRVSPFSCPGDGREARCGSHLRSGVGPDHDPSCSRERARVGGAILLHGRWRPARTTASAGPDPVAIRRAELDDARSCHALSTTPAGTTPCTA
jgi:hypothetical protein